MPVATNFVPKRKAAAGLFDTDFCAAMNLSIASAYSSRLRLAAMATRDKACPAGVPRGTPGLPDLVML